MLAIEARKLFDGQTFIRLARPTLLIDDDRIVDIVDGPLTGKMARRVEAAIALPGATLLPGLIDCHVHLAMPADGNISADFSTITTHALAERVRTNAATALGAGITSVRDCGGPAAVLVASRAQFARDVEQGPAIFLSGPPLTQRNGHCRGFGGEVDDLAGAIAHVDELVPHVDFIKVVGSGGGTPGTRHDRPTFGRRDLRAIVDAAHDRGRIVAAHSLNAAATARALWAGVDAIEHVAFITDANGNEQVDGDVVELLARMGVPMTTTLSSRHFQARALAEAEPHSSVVHEWQARLHTQARVVASVADAGVVLAAGTDAGWRHTPFDGLWTEIALLAATPLGIVGALAAATSRAAALIGAEGRLGRLAAGWQADVIAVSDDLEARVPEQVSPQMVIRKGALVAGDPDRRMVV